MCGITGYIDFTKSTLSETIEEMVQTLYHRGPDDRGTEHFKTDNAVIGMGQARLSIIDLSPAGHQPMHYKNYCIVFNGEIYNYKEIRKDLEKAGHHFLSHSDTEVILHAYEYWGVEFLHRLIGMFVIAIYDKNVGKFIIFRDRAGIKPIYYYWHNGLFLFASELKALNIHSDFKKLINDAALRLFFDFGYVPAPYTIFENTHKIEPGRFITIDLVKKDISYSTYWDINDFYRLPKLDINYSDAKDQIHELLISAYNYRMVADVPVGIFLSGGYDSTSVSAILQKDRTRKLKTFTIGFEEGNNEVPFARETARLLGTDHNEYTCTTREAQEIIPVLSYYYDEPFADSSAIPTILVSRLARKQVTVALSADAGDEIFAGYGHYIKLGRHLKQLNLIPDMFKSITRPVIDKISNLFPSICSEAKHEMNAIAHSLNKDRFFQASQLLRFSGSLPGFYSNNLFKNKTKRLITKYDNDFYGFLNEIDVMLALDYQMYLQNDILAKVDRATMSVSLEGREPLLDHRLIEFVAQLPVDYKIEGNASKRILKDIVHDYIPKELMDHPKTGFSLPIYSWLLRDLRYLVDEYLSDKAIAESGLFNVGYVSHIVRLFRSNKLYYKSFIWKLLMFQMWYARWMKG